MTRTGIAIVVVGLAGAAAVAAVGLNANSAALAPSEAAGVLETTIREAALGLHARLATLSELPRLRAAVSTDAATVADLTRDELSLEPHGAEVIAIAQRSLLGPPIRSQLLVVLPAARADAPPPIDNVGTMLRIQEDKLHLCETMLVKPFERGTEVQGIIAACWPVNLDPLETRLAEKKVAGRLTVNTGEGAGAISVGERVVPVGGQSAELSLTKPPASGITLSLMSPKQPSSAAFFAGAAGIAIVAFTIAGMLGRKRVPGPQGQTAVGIAGISPPIMLSSPNQSATGMRMIGRYTCLRLLGRGGMAEVFLARATGEAGFEKLVALKVLQAPFAQEVIAVEHFLDEAKLVSRLAHPNIVQTMDLGRVGNEFYIAMEYVDGADLMRLIEVAQSRRPPANVPLPVALAILRRLCDGLHAAHTATDAAGSPLGLIHRDVKAANVFLDKNGAVKIGDFGIAKVSTVSRTEIGQVKGTPGYMAPEHRMGQPIDRRIDIYGVGAIAYEILTGMPVNLDLAVLVERGKEGWPHLEPPSKIRPELPLDLDTIVFRALAYDRNARFASCAELEEAIEQIANRYPPVAGEKAIAQWVGTLLADAHAKTETGTSMSFGR